MAVFAFLGAAGAAAQPGRVVSDESQLREALRSARAGDTIIMKNGTWRDADIELTAAGTPSSPITLRAETPGGVILTGSSRLTLSAPYVVVEGLHFKDGALNGGAVVRFASHHGRLSDSAVVDYNPRDGTTEYWWVVFEGDDNAVLRSLFKGKSNRRPVVSNRAGARRNRVLDSHFQDIAWKDENGRETIQIMGYGTSEELGDDGAFFTLEPNTYQDNIVSGAPPVGTVGPGIQTLALPVSDAAVSRAGSGSPLVERDDSAAARRPLRPDQVGPTWLRKR